MENTRVRNTAAGALIVAAIAAIGAVAMTRPLNDGKEGERVRDIAGSVAGIVETGSAAPRALNESASGAANAAAEPPAPQAATGMPAQPGGRIVWVPVLILNPQSYRPVLAIPAPGAYRMAANPGFVHNPGPASPRHVARALPPSLSWDMVTLCGVSGAFCWFK